MISFVTNFHKAENMVWPDMHMALDSISSITKTAGVVVHAIILVLERWELKDQKFKATFSYLVNTKRAKTI